MIPYANLTNMRGGVNIGNENRFNVYMKNCCVALLSAKKYNNDSDVALVTNTNIPNEYEKILAQNQISVIHVDFDTFKFSEDYKWGLAFYKLCALKYIVDNYDYDYISYVDSDVYIQQSFDSVFKECEHSILLYDINHGLQVKDYRLFLKDYYTFSGSEKTITHYGGEFFAASRENAKIFIQTCYEIYLKMLEKDFSTDFGDEFIISQAADKHRSLTKNAGAYIFRFWTGDFRLVSTCYKYNPITVIHVPDEKNSGMLKLYDYYTKTGKLPSIQKVHSFLNLKHIKFKTAIKILLGKC